MQDFADEDLEHGLTADGDLVGSEERGAFGAQRGGETALHGRGGHPRGGTPVAEKTQFPARFVQEHTGLSVLEVAETRHCHFRFLFLSFLSFY